MAQRDGAILAMKQPLAETLAAKLKEIIEKCEQYWNANGLCDAEIHAALAAIHKNACSLRDALAAQETLVSAQGEARRLLYEFVGYISAEYKWPQERWENCGKLADRYLAVAPLAAQTIEGGERETPQSAILKDWSKRLWSVSQHDNMVIENAGIIQKIARELDEAAAPSEEKK